MTWYEVVLRSNESVDKNICFSFNLRYFIVQLKPKTKTFEAIKWMLHDVSINI
jgi:hypothetical protein